MFGKLLKYDWKSVWHTVGVLCLGAIGAGIVGALAIRGLENIENSNFLSIMTVVALMVVVIYFIGFGIGSVLIPLARFCQSRFGDEGFLTHTLPVTTHQLLLSSLLCVLGSTLLACVSILLGGSILMIYGGTNFDGHRMELLSEMFRFLTEGLRTVGYANVFVTILATCIQLVADMVLVMFSLTAGAVISRKNMILVALLVYFGINIVVDSALVTGILTLALPTLEPSFPVVMWASCLWNLALAAAGYFATYYLFQKKLNLN